MSAARVRRDGPVTIETPITLLASGRRKLAAATGISPASHAAAEARLAAGRLLRQAKTIRGLRRQVKVLAAERHASDLRALELEALYDSARVIIREYQDNEAAQAGDPVVALQQAIRQRLLFLADKFDGQPADIVEMRALASCWPADEPSGLAAVTR